MNVINFDRKPKKLSEMTVSTFDKKEFEKAIEEEKVEKKVKSTFDNAIVGENNITFDDLSDEEKIIYGR